MVNTKVGIQGYTISRGFILADDASGVIATADFGNVQVPFLFSTISAKNANDIGWDGNGADNVAFTSNDGSLAGFGNGQGDIYLVGLTPSIKINDSFTLMPHSTWITVTSQDTDVYYLGLDADMKFGDVSGWVTTAYNGGKIDKSNFPGATKNQDISAYLLAAGADAGIVHGQAFYASGDDDANDNDIDSFTLVGGTGYGASYYWSEILGLGTFDNQAGGSLGDKITNIWALNAGVTLKPMDKLKLDFDVWYAQTAEKVVRPTTSNPNNTEDELGLEIDTKLTYELMDNLNAEFIFAYLFAGEVIGKEDVIEGGLQLSLKF
jgi:hypothetical protein